MMKIFSPEEFLYIVLERVYGFDFAKNFYFLTFWYLLAKSLATNSVIKIVL